VAVVAVAEQMAQAITVLLAARGLLLFGIGHRKLLSSYNFQF
jgi:hypothetical protein